VQVSRPAFSAPKDQQLNENWSKLSQIKAAAALWVELMK
jgi:hypothetical protein